MDALFNPHDSDFAEFDARTQAIFRATIDFFETRGKAALLAADRDNVWYADFLEFVKRERVFATFLTPAAEASGDPDKRWDTARNAKYSQILGFYGMQYWYTWQVTVLGLGPIWQSANQAAKDRAAQLLERGEIFAFGLSEKEHGADVYSTDMVLSPQADGSFRANGAKHYIGNGNLAGMVSVFGRRADKPIYDSSDIERHGSDEEFDGYVFFAADSQHPNYKLERNVVDAQMYVAAFELDDYPVASADILHTGKAAFHAAMNTVNIAKFNLGPGAVGMCEHAFHEAITHAENRILFGHRVTEFPQVVQLITDCYARVVAMKLYTERAVDYMRSGAPEDRRYLLIDAIEKMSVTRQGERVVKDLSDVIAARAFENDMYFPMAMLGAFGLPRLEGTVHVNMALALKFMANYMFHPSDAGLAALAHLPAAGSAPEAPVRVVASALKQASRAATPVLGPRVPALARALKAASVAEVRRRRDPSDDEFLFRQGPSAGLSKVRFQDWRPIFQAFDRVPNVDLFLEQAEAFQALLVAAKPTAAQQKDVSFLFALGELFTLIPYAQLILEQAALEELDDAVLDQIFDVLVREFSTHAVALHSHPGATGAQQTRALDLIRRPVADQDRFARVCEQARAHAGKYEMNL